MNRQRKVLITVTYNDLGIIVDTKAEELDLSAQPNLQPTCNNLATDTISRQAAIDAAKDWYDGLICGSFRGLEKRLKALPSAEPDVTRCGKCTHKDKKIDYCHYLGITICECDYCSYAVRRADELGNS